MLKLQLNDQTLFLLRVTAEMIGCFFPFELALLEEVAKRLNVCL